MCLPDTNFHLFALQKHVGGVRATAYLHAVAKQRGKKTVEVRDIAFVENEKMAKLGGVPDHTPVADHHMSPDERSASDHGVSPDNGRTVNNCSSLYRASFTELHVPGFEPCPVFHVSHNPRLYDALNETR